LCLPLCLEVRARYRRRHMVSPKTEPGIWDLTLTIYMPLDTTYASKQEFTHCFPERTFTVFKCVPAGVPVTCKRTIEDRSKASGNFCEFRGLYSYFYSYFRHFDVTQYYKWLIMNEWRSWSV